MRILVACEESQVVTKAFREKGHDAYSCDILDCSGGHPEWHLCGDINEYLNGLELETYDGEEFHDLSSYEKELANKGVIQNDVLEWDIIIAFPPCTDLCVSGARWFKQKQADGRQQESINFFMAFTELDIPWAIENPIGIMSTHYRKPDQIIQPWQFGHGETKATCLWLNELPELKPTNIVEGREQRIWKLPPSKDRAMLRSKTYYGIAQAMADQWG